MIEGLCTLNILQFLCLFFGHIGKWLDKKAMVKFKIYGITDWQSRCNRAMKFSEYNVRTQRH